MSKPLLTAIIFTYNHKDTIARCIESHLHQKTAFDYQIRIYDDCSTDGTSDVCREYAHLYPDRIKLTVQAENTFTKPYLELQSFKAISELDTKYFSICDGDDCWCNEEKVQTALELLERHPEYQGFAHDTYFDNVYTKERKSYIHGVCGFGEVGNPVNLSASAPFFMVSSRIFRTAGYANLKILPIDYLEYYYHLSRGPIYYYDEPMAIHTIGSNNTYATSSMDYIRNNSAMMTYRLSKLFNFKRDDFCMDLLVLYEKRHGVGDRRHRNLIALKRVFGVRLGWGLWFFLHFAWKYGIGAANVNYVYRNRRKVRENADPQHRRKRRQEQARCVGSEISGKYRRYLFLKYVLGACFPFCKRFTKMLRDSMLKRKKKMLLLNKRRHELLSGAKEDK